tara:strand:- start:1133 stop:1684 length:552 start_codon:yes stop_codon:yes gene_type:complete
MFLDQVSPRSLLMVVLATSSVCIRHVVFLLLLPVLLAIVLRGHMSAYVIVETTIVITVLLLQHVDLWVQKLKMVEHCQSLILVLDSQQLLLPDLLDTVLEVLTTSCKFKVKLLSASGTLQFILVEHVAATAAFIRMIVKDAVELLVKVTCRFLEQVVGLDLHVVDKTPTVQTEAEWVWFAYPG